MSSERSTPSSALTKVCMPANWDSSTLNAASLEAFSAAFFSAMIASYSSRDICFSSSFSDSTAASSSSSSAILSTFSSSPSVPQLPLPPP